MTKNIDQKAEKIEIGKRLVTHLNGMEKKARRTHRWHVNYENDISDSFIYGCGITM